MLGKGDLWLLHSCRLVYPCHVEVAVSTEDVVQGFAASFQSHLLDLLMTKSRGSGLLWIYWADKQRKTQLVSFVFVLSCMDFDFRYFILLWFYPWKIFIAISRWYNSNPGSINGNNKLIIWHFQNFQHNKQLNYFSKNMYSTKYNGQMFKVLQMFSMALDFDF